jgi:hypothetical protein
MKSQEDVERLLEHFGKAWPEGGSIVAEVMQKIESLPAPAGSPSRRRVVIKSLIGIGIAASVATIALFWWGAAGGRDSLYAQVVNAANNARTLHTINYAQAKEGGEPFKYGEAWYQRGAGFRQEGPGGIHLGNEEYLWTYTKDRNVAIRSRSNGIAKATGPIFAEIDRRAQQLQNEYERYPSGDQEFDGLPCKAYLLTKPDRHVEPLKTELKTGQRRMLLFLDRQSRLVRAVTDRREDNHWKTEFFTRFEYDEPIDPKLFQPDFGKDVKVVDADSAFEEFDSLRSAVHVEERSGLIYAIHRVERFENGGVLVVSSVRGTEETLKKYPLTKRPLRPGQFLVDGPARDYHGSPQGSGYFRFQLASATHQGIDLSWWVVIPRDSPPTHFEVAPGRIKLRVGVSPHGEFAKSFADQRSVIHHLTWDVEVDAPRPVTLATLEEMTNRIYADQVALAAVPFKWLWYDDTHEWKSAEVGKITPAEYTKLVAKTFRRWMQGDIDFQIDGQFKPKSQRESRQWMGDRIAIFLSYNSLVNDAILPRVAKRTSVTELFLRGTRITDDGLKHLDGLTKLEELDLAETGITDAGLRHLTGLATLKLLVVTDTKVTADGVAMLQQAIPNVEIRWKANGKP